MTSQDEDSLSPYDPTTTHDAQNDGHMTCVQQDVMPQHSAPTSHGMTTTDSVTREPCPPLHTLTMPPLTPAPSGGGSVGYNLTPGHAGMFGTYPSEYTAPSNHPQPTTLPAPVPRIKSLNRDFPEHTQPHDQNGYTHLSFPVSGFNISAVSGAMAMSSPSSLSGTPAYWSDGAGRAATCGLGENYGAGLAYPKYPGGQYDVWSRGGYQDQRGVRPYEGRSGRGGDGTSITATTGKSY